ncbi:DUF4236 domain-containing protein [Bacillus tianshenii]|nr:DUF4236 domain-containing protein [Bacillus tianshenii]
MGFGFRKSIKIAPGVKMNVGKKGVGVSVGGKGFRHSINSSGRSRTTLSIPGTGVSYSSYGKSYSSQAYQRRQELARQERELEKLEQIRRNELEVKLFENKLEMIKSIHKESDEPINWHKVKLTPPPFIKNETGPAEYKALKALKDYEPSFLDKLLKKQVKQKVELEAQVNRARLEDQQAYEEWEYMNETAEKILSGDIDTYLEVINELNPLDDLLEFGSGFEFFVDKPELLEVEFDVHTELVVPSSLKTLTKTGKVSTKKMPKGQYYDLQQDYICSCVLRIARDMFALLPIETIYIHAMDEQVNSATGHKEKITLLSVKIDKATLTQLNFDRIDCSDSMTNFEHNMKFLKTKGLQPVQKLQIIENSVTN